MSHTFTKLYYHVVFSTKNRLPMLTPEIRPRVFTYLGGAISNEGGHPIIINGVADHVHLLMELRPKQCVAELTGSIKANSSSWIKETFGISDFSWQEGYGAFTVSAGEPMKAAFRYIEKQERHHQKQDFRTEFLRMLRLAQVEFEEQYLWK